MPREPGKSSKPGKITASRAHSRTDRGRDHRERALSVDHRVCHCGGHRSASAPGTRSDGTSVPGGFDPGIAGTRSRRRGRSARSPLLQGRPAPITLPARSGRRWDRDRRAQSERRDLGSRSCASAELSSRHKDACCTCDELRSAHTRERPRSDPELAHSPRTSVNSVPLCLCVPVPRLQGR